MKRREWQATTIGLALVILAAWSNGRRPALTDVVDAKRSAPAEVEQIVHDGTRYVVEHLDHVGRRAEPGGYVQAWDVASKRMLWERIVYRTRYNEQVERDVQDVFITRIELVDGKLFVDNELGEHYEMDIASGSVVALVKKSDRTEVPVVRGHKH